MKWCCREGKTNGIVNSNNREMVMIIFKGGGMRSSVLGSWYWNTEMAIDFFIASPEDLKSMNWCWNSTKSSVSVISLECFELQSLCIQESEPGPSGTYKERRYGPLTSEQLCNHAPPLGNNHLLRRSVLWLRYREYKWFSQSLNNKTKTKILLPDLFSLRKITLFPSASCGRK